MALPKTAGRDAAPADAGRGAVPWPAHGGAALFAETTESSKTSEVAGDHAASLYHSLSAERN